MAPTTSRGPRHSWSEDSLRRAVQAVVDGELSMNKSSITYSIPRRTLREHVSKNKTTKSKLGRKPVLSQDEEKDLVNRIRRLSNVGYPLTPKSVRLCVYRYCKTNRKKTPFSKKYEIAGRYWFKGFMERNQEISIRKCQNLNPARAMKLNPFIVNDHFGKLREVMLHLGVVDKPQKIYNMDEKGCRLCLHKQQRVLAQTGARRVHLVAEEHGENATIVACINAVGNAVPPMILYKGKRMKPEWTYNLPAGSVCRMTDRGSMTTAVFRDWLAHFASFKTPGRCLLIFDGAKSHLDYSVVEEAEKYDITLYCLPSNTTHELQPLDKAVFKPFETYWDQELMRFWDRFQTHTIRRGQFGMVLTPCFERAMTQSNIKSGFASTGIFPFNSNAIPDEAFAPSDTTKRSAPPAAGECLPNLTAAEDQTMPPLAANECRPSCSTSTPLRTKERRVESGTDFDDNDEEDLMDMTMIGTIHEEKEPASPQKISEDTNSQNTDDSFSSMLSTPKMKDKGMKKRPALNSRALILSRDVFKQMNENGTKKQSCKTVKPKMKAKKIRLDELSAKKHRLSVKTKNCTQEDTVKTIKKKRETGCSAKKINKNQKLTETKSYTEDNKEPDKQEESWFCFVCDRDEVLDMRLCFVCGKYVHEECVGLAPEDKEMFVCPICQK